MQEEQDRQETASQHFGSDDDDYDEIFMECVSGDEVQQPWSTNSNPQDPDDMDMTDG
jgi:hypothetical protein